jgi:hypothetical protein
MDVDDNAAEGTGMDIEDNAEIDEGADEKVEELGKVELAFQIFVNSVLSGCTGFYQIGHDFCVVQGWDTGKEVATVGGDCHVLLHPSDSELRSTGIICSLPLWWTGPSQ